MIRATAAKIRAPFIQVERGSEFSAQFADLFSQLPLRGQHQVTNATLAMAVLCVLSEKIPLSADALPKGVETVQWPGRFQVVQRGTRKIILDGAHNPDGAKTLAEELEKHFRGQSLTLILGLFNDKAWQQMCDVLVPRATRVLLVPLSSERSADPIEVQQYCAEKWPQVQTRGFARFAEAMAMSENEALVVVAGSLHLIGEAMEVLKLSTSIRSERGLNEWNAANVPQR